MTNTILNCDVLEGMKSIEDNSIDTIITSPPYYFLRNYGYPEQWGMEKTFVEYLDKMISFMAECKRVIKDSGSIWINLGDSYNGSGQDSGKSSREISQNIIGKGRLVGDASPTSANKDKSLPNKSLMLIPHRFAIRCCDELGLILRNDIIWAKPNGMPESVTDRFSKKHEFIFFFVKSQKYFFDLDGVRGKPTGRTDAIKFFGRNNKARGEYKLDAMKGRNPGDVSDFWNITTKGSSDKHYATFNSELIDKPIVAGCPEFVCVKCGKAREKIINIERPESYNPSEQDGRNEGRGTTRNRPLTSIFKDTSKQIRTLTGYTDCNCKAGFTGGTVLDPFAGSGTTLQRALQLNRNVIGIEASKEYYQIAEKKINKELIKIKLF